MSKAEEYLLEIGLDSDLLPEFFNNNDKSYYSVPELMESFAQERIQQEREKWERELEVLKVFIDPLTGLCYDKLEKEYGKSVCGIIERIIETTK